MQQIKTKRSNFVFKLPGDTTGEGDLPCVLSSDRHRVYSTWELSKTERIAIAEGANIELCVWANPPPPVSLIVDRDLKEILNLNKDS